MELYTSISAKIIDDKTLFTENENQGVRLLDHSVIKGIRAL